LWQFFSAARSSQPRLKRGAGGTATTIADIIIMALIITVITITVIGTGERQSQCAQQPEAWCGLSVLPAPLWLYLPAVRFRLS
jgi:hypothetical protein